MSLLGKICLVTKQEKKSLKPEANVRDNKGPNSRDESDECKASLKDPSVK